MCQKTKYFLALTLLEQAVAQQHNANQPIDTFQKASCSFMNCLVEEHCNLNQDSCACNIRRKRRAIEYVTPPPNQDSTSSVVPHVQIVS